MTLSSLWGVSEASLPSSHTPIPGQKVLPGLSASPPYRGSSAAAQLCPWSFLMGSNCSSRSSLIDPA